MGGATIVVNCCALFLIFEDQTFSGCFQKKEMEAMNHTSLTRDNLFPNNTSETQKRWKINRKQGIIQYH